MKENVSGCFFLNTVYMTELWRWWCLQDDVQTSYCGSSTTNDDDCLLRLILVSRREEQRQ